MVSKAHLSIKRIDAFPSVRLFIRFIVCIHTIALENSRSAVIYNLVSGKCNLSFLVSVPPLEKAGLFL